MLVCGGLNPLPGIVRERKHTPLWGVGVGVGDVTGMGMREITSQEENLEKNYSAYTPNAQKCLNKTH